MNRARSARKVQVPVSLDPAMLPRIERIRRAYGDRLPDATYTRGHVLRAAIERGLAAIERGLRRKRGRQ